MTEDTRRPLRRTMDVGSRGPLSPGQLVHPDHMRQPSSPDQGVNPRLYKNK